jgi:catechol 2,3-dioxygenase-like lactoylglutathione lyase family enzyme
MFAAIRHDYKRSPHDTFLNLPVERPVMSEPLPILGLHHLSLTTSDTDRSVRFYCELLGFRQLTRPNFNFRGAWLWGYGFQIHLIENAAKVPQSSEIDTRADHIALAVNDTQEIVSRLDARGIEYRQQVNAGGIAQTFFHDPDGHQIELAVYPPTPKYLE